MLLFSGCQKEFEKATPNAGNADFSSYVAVGGSMAAGFADGALCKDGQLASYPNLLAQQFKLAGGGDFSIPLLKGSLGVYPDYDAVNNNFSKTKSRLVLQQFIDCKNEQVLLPRRLALLGDDEINLYNISQKISNPIKPYQHWGIPAMKVADLTAIGYGELVQYTQNAPFSPFFWRLVDNSNFTYILLELLKSKPTFFTLDLGTSDVLTYATEGGNGSQTDGITTELSFKYNLDLLLDSLTSKGRKGVMANIPNILKFPYFTKIEYNKLDIKDTARALALTTQYASAGLKFKVGRNPFVIKEGGTVRFVLPTEFVTLKTPVDSLKCANWGAEKPLDPEYILTIQEQENVRAAIALFNGILTDRATKLQIPIVDINAYFETIFAHKYFEGIEFSDELVSGGFFSLDGLHPSKRGQALVANEFIRVINESYKANIPKVSVADTEGIRFP